MLDMNYTKLEMCYVAAEKLCILAEMATKTVKKKKTIHLLFYWTRKENKPNE